MKFNIFDYPIITEIPDRLTDVESWHGLTPIAFGVMAMHKPAVFVELGTHKGDSYCAFCQAVDRLGLDTACYAVDTWQGEEHAGFYDHTVLEELRRYHDERYSRFSRLLQSSFDDALTYFADGTIDLLHIDGLHTYEAVKHDFETWLPKMSKRGLVLLHDINVRERGFGVWRLWRELSERYSSLEFNFSNGLGMLAVGEKLDDPMQEIFILGQDKRKQISQYLYILGHRVLLSGQKMRLMQQLESIKHVVLELDATITSKNEQILARERQIEEQNQRFAKEFTEQERKFSEVHRKDEERIAQLATELAVKSSNKQTMAGELASLRKACLQKDEEIEVLKARFHTVHAEYQSVLDSRTWRMMYPVRLIGSLIKPFMRDLIRGSENNNGEGNPGVVSKKNLLKVITYFRNNGVKATSRKIIQKMMLADSAMPSLPSEHRSIQSGGVQPDCISAARSLLATGIMNGCWYGGTEIGFISKELRSEAFFQEACRVCEQIDSNDTKKILDFLHQRSPPNDLACDAGRPGGGPSLELYSIGPTSDIEQYLAMVAPPAYLEKNIAAVAEPTFTIVTSFYRHYRYFEACSSSISDLFVASATDKLEWIVINDDPRFSAEDIKKAIPASLTENASIVSDGKNLGICARLNQAISLAKHGWILFVDCDDLIHAEAVNVLSGYIKRFPRCRYISSNMVDIDEDGHTMRYRRRISPPSKLLGEGMIAGHLKAIRCDAFSEYGGFDDAFNGCQDYEFALRLSIKEPLLFIPEYLYYYRWHGFSESVNASYRQTVVSNTIVKKYMSQIIDCLEQAKTPQQPLTKSRFQKISKVQRQIWLEGTKEFMNPSGVAIIRTTGRRLELLTEALNSVAMQGEEIKALVVVHGDNDALRSVMATVNGMSIHAEILHAQDTHRYRGYPINVALKHLYDSDENFDFLFFLDDDDIIYPMFATKMLEALAHSNADVIYAASNRRIPWKPVEPGYMPLPASCLLVGNFIPINSYCVRYSSLKALGLLIDESLNYLEDWNFLLRMFGHRLKFFAIGDVLSEFRITGDGNTPIKQNPEAWEKCAQIIRMYVDKICRDLGRYYLFSELISFDLSIRDGLTESEQGALRMTKALIEEKCPMAYSFDAPVQAIGIQPAALEDAGWGVDLGL
jgi:glycosyltransferase involved in cell wall biosynthesis